MQLTYLSCRIGHRTLFGSKRLSHRISCTATELTYTRKELLRTQVWSSRPFHITLAPDICVQL
jgi:hypothetical protein